MLLTDQSVFEFLLFDDAILDLVKGCEEAA